MNRACISFGLLSLTFVAPIFAQSAPPVAMRPAQVRRDLIDHATVVVKPGERIEDGAVLVEDGWITAVGKSGAVIAPAGTNVIDAKGLTLYPGLIDAGFMIDSAAAARAAAEDATHYWNDKVTPQVRVANMATLASAVRKEMRDLGFTVASVNPNSGIFRGESAVVLLANDDEKVEQLVANAGQNISFAHVGDEGPDSSRYPTALMGTMAVIRQGLLDAQWLSQSNAVWKAHPQGNDSPKASAALAALEPVIQGKSVVIFDCNNEQDVLRAAGLAKEFGLKARVIGSGNEFRRLNEVVATRLPIVETFDFPKTPDVSDPRKDESVSLRDLETWALAPRNVKQLIDAGVDVSVGTAKLKNRGDFPARARRAMLSGLSEDELLSCLTTRPAKQLGLSSVVGTIEVGRMANMVLLDGPLFGEKTHVMATMVAGDKVNVYEPVIFGFKGPCTLKSATLELAGNFDPETKVISFETLAPSVTAAGDAKPAAAVVDAKVADTKPTAPVADAKVADTKPVAAVADAKVADAKPAAPVADAPAIAVAAKPFEPKKYAAEHVDFDLDRVGFTLPGEALASEGVLRCTAIRIGDRVDGVAQTRDGKSIVFTLTKREVAKVADTKTGDAKVADARSTNVKVADAKPVDTKVTDAKPSTTVAASPEKKTEDPLAFIPAVTPLGEYGFEKAPVAQTVLVKNATIWTSGPAGTLKNADLLVVNGKVKAVGANLANIPADAVVIDATNKHVTPGLIDCHSHTGIEGGVNEGTNNDTAECRIGDCIDPDAVGWYRELAGGLTAANQLHGSANPIGGQNSVVKLKWGGSANDFRINDAIPGIKFALGENVTRPRGRYPNTRMGVEALIRDSFRGAREYAAKQSEYAALTDEQRAITMPPRRDLQLDTLAEILAGKRLIHCHSYRQDEILMLLRLAEEFNFRIGTFQHVLEGYKVADLIAKHGAGASTFSDWWAYKMEVMDAVPFNGAMMHDVGVVVSFNSDSDEMARRLNMEAAKAVKYGGCTPVEALKFVTLNPAKQLRIDNRVGSLEVGKDGDFVIWSGDPLSSFSLADSTWIEGACYFNRANDHILRERDMKLRSHLLELAVAEGEKSGNLKTTEPPKVDPAKDAKPAAAPTTLLTRMLDLRREALVDQVRRGRDPDSMGPGDCGCGGSIEGWKILLEEVSK